MKKMTRKRFCKLLMAHGFGRNMAQAMSGVLIAIRRIGDGRDLILKCDDGHEYHMKDVRSYRTAYESFEKDGVPLV